MFGPYFNIYQSKLEETLQSLFYLQEIFYKLFVHSHISLNLLLVLSTDCHILEKNIFLYSFDSKYCLEEQSNTPKLIIIFNEIDHIKFYNI